MKMTSICLCGASTVINGGLEPLDRTQFCKVHSNIQPSDKGLEDDTLMSFECGHSWVFHIKILCSATFKTYKQFQESIGECDGFESPRGAMSRWLGLISGMFTATCVGLTKSDG